MIVSAVLRRSLMFGPEHMEWLGRQVARVYPDAEFRPFSDVPLSIPYQPLHLGLPTWWSKLEAYRCLPNDTVLMLDIDTVLTKQMDIPLPLPGKAYMQCSPRNTGKLWGALQISSPEFRRDVTDDFFRDPNARIAECNGCDQVFYASKWMHRLKLLNAARPDAVVSYKMHVIPYGLQPENAFVLFHAIPRPWDCSHDWIPPLSE